MYDAPNRQHKNHKMHTRYTFQHGHLYLKSHPPWGWLVTLIHRVSGQCTVIKKRNVIIKTENRCTRTLLEYPCLGWWSSEENKTKQRKQNFCPLLFVIWTIIDNKEVCK